MSHNEISIIITNIIAFLIDYFSVRENRIFWLLVLFFAVIVENIPKAWRRKNYIKLWLKEHNIGKKYRW